MQQLIVWGAVLWGVGTFTLLATADSNVPQTTANSDTSETLKGEVSGEVDIDKDVRQTLGPYGALYIYVKASGHGLPPVAEKKIPHPKFPVNFTVTEADRVEQGFRFEGDLIVQARYSPSGQEFDYSGGEGSDPKHQVVHVGQKDIKILLQTWKEKMRKQKAKRP